MDDAVKEQGRRHECMSQRTRRGTASSNLAFDRRATLENTYGLLLAGKKTFMDAMDLSFLF